MGIQLDIRQRGIILTILVLTLAFFPIFSSLGLSTSSITVGTNGIISYPQERNPDLFKGVNLSPRDFWSASQIDVSDFSRIKSWGIDHVRLHLHWHTVETRRDNPGVYNENFLSQVDQYVEWATANDLFVILGMSKANDGTDGWMEWDEFFLDPIIRERFYNVSTMIISRYSGYENVIGFTPMHVPGHNINNLTRLDEYQVVWHNIMIPEIVNRTRQINSEAIIVYEPVLPFPQHFEDLTPITGNNIWYSFNFYEPGAVTHRQWEYNGDQDSIKNSDWWQNVITFGSTYNVTLYAGEFGIEIRGAEGYAEPPTESRQLWVRHVLQMYEEHEVHWAYWIYGYDRWGFDLLNADGSERAVVDILKEYTLQ